MSTAQPVRRRRRRGTHTNFVRTSVDLTPTTKAKMAAVADALGVSMSRSLDLLYARVQLDEEGHALNLAALGVAEQEDLMSA